MFSRLVPVTLNEVPWVASVCGQTHAPGSHSVKAQANRGSGKGGALQVAAGRGVQPCRAGPCSALGAVVLFTVRLVPQDAVHLVRDGRRQLRKDLQGAGGRVARSRGCLKASCCYTLWPLEGAGGRLFCTIIGNVTD